MANTLNLGDGKWATKEGSLLAYNSENNNYKPLPFSFTRDSLATRVNKEGLIEVVSNDVPRIDYTDSTEGVLLLEPSRTNSITNSEEFGSTGWSFVTTGSAIAPIVSNNYAISPDGTQNAQRIQFDLGGGTTSSDRTIIRQDVGVQSDWFFSVWIKSTNGQEQKILWHVGGDENETTVTGEWQRYTFNRNGTATSFLGLSLRGSTSTVDTADILVWGFQAEQGSYATSYIPTQGSSVTRVADSCSGAGNDQVINSTEGVLYVETKGFIDVPPTSKYIQLSKSGEASFNNSLVLQHRNNGYFRVYANGTDSANIQFNVNVDFTQNHKIAVLYKLNGYKLFIDGVEKNLFQTPLQTVFSGLNDFSFDNRGGNGWSGEIKEVKLYNTALTDQELIALTT